MGKRNMNRNIDLEKAATLFTLAIPENGMDRHFGAHSTFESVRGAVRFCIEELEPRLRRTAWIQTAVGSISNEEIKEIYKGL